MRLKLLILFLLYTAYAVKAVYEDEKKVDGSIPNAADIKEANVESIANAADIKDEKVEGNTDEVGSISGTKSDSNSDTEGSTSGSETSSKKHKWTIPGAVEYLSQSQAYGNKNVKAKKVEEWSNQAMLSLILDRRGYAGMDMFIQLVGQPEMKNMIPENMDVGEWKKQMEEEHKKVDELNRKIPEQLEAMVNRVLSKKRVDRDNLIMEAGERTGRERAVLEELIKEEKKNKLFSEKEIKEIAEKYIAERREERRELARSFLKWIAKRNIQPSWFYAKSTVEERKQLLLKFIGKKYEQDMFARKEAKAIYGMDVSSEYMEKSMGNDNFLLPPDISGFVMKLKDSKGQGKFRSNNVGIDAMLLYVQKKLEHGIAKGPEEYEMMDPKETLRDLELPEKDCQMTLRVGKKMRHYAYLFDEAVTIPQKDIEKFLNLKKDGKVRDVETGTGLTGAEIEAFLEKQRKTKLGKLIEEMKKRAEKREIEKEKLVKEGGKATENVEKEEEEEEEEDDEKYTQITTYTLLEVIQKGKKVFGPNAMLSWENLAKVENKLRSKNWWSPALGRIFLVLEKFVLFCRNAFNHTKIGDFLNNITQLFNNELDKKESDKEKMLREEYEKSMKKHVQKDKAAKKYREMQQAQFVKNDKPLAKIAEKSVHAFELLHDVHYQIDVVPGDIAHLPVWLQNQVIAHMDNLDDYEKYLDYNQNMLKRKENPEKYKKEMKEPVFDAVAEQQLRSYEKKEYALNPDDWWKKHDQSYKACATLKVIVQEALYPKLSHKREEQLDPINHEVRGRLGASILLSIMNTKRVTNDMLVGLALSFVVSGGIAFIIDFCILGVITLLIGLTPLAAPITVPLIIGISIVVPTITPLLAESADSFLVKRLMGLNRGKPFWPKSPRELKQNIKEALVAGTIAAVGSVPYNVLSALTYFGGWAFLPLKAFANFIGTGTSAAMVPMEVEKMGGHTGASIIMKMQQGFLAKPDKKEILASYGGKAGPIKDETNPEWKDQETLALHNYVKEKTERVLRVAKASAQAISSMGTGATIGFLFGFLFFAIPNELGWINESVMEVGSIAFNAPTEAFSMNIQATTGEGVGSSSSAKQNVEEENQFSRKWLSKDSTKNTQMMQLIFLKSMEQLDEQAETELNGKGENKKGPGIQAVHQTQKTKEEEGKQVQAVYQTQKTKEEGGQKVQAVQQSKNAKEEEGQKVQAVYEEEEIADTVQISDKEIHAVFRTMLNYTAPFGEWIINTMKKIFIKLGLLEDLKKDLEVDVLKKKVGADVASTGLLDEAEIVVENWRQNVVYLIQRPRASRTPGYAPKDLMLETWLKFRKIPFYRLTNARFLNALFSEQLPFVELNGEQIFGSTDKIIESLNEKLYFGRHLHDSEFYRQGLEMRKLIDNVVSSILLYDRQHPYEIVLNSKVSKKQPNKKNDKLISLIMKDANFEKLIKEEKEALEKESGKKSAIKRLLKMWKDNSVLWEAKDLQGSLDLIKFRLHIHQIPIEYNEEIKKELAKEKKETSGKKFEQEPLLPKGEEEDDNAQITYHQLNAHQIVKIMEKAFDKIKTQLEENIAGFGTGEFFRLGYHRTLANATLFAHLVQFLDYEALNIAEMRKYFEKIKHNPKHVFNIFVKQIVEFEWGLKELKMEWHNLGKENLNYDFESEWREKVDNNKFYGPFGIIADDIEPYEDNKNQPPLSAHIFGQIESGGTSVAIPEQKADEETDPNLEMVEEDSSDVREWARELLAFERLPLPKDNEEDKGKAIVPSDISLIPYPPVLKLIIRELYEIGQFRDDLALKKKYGLDIDLTKVYVTNIIEKERLVQLLSARTEQFKNQIELYKIIKKIKGEDGKKSIHTIRALLHFMAAYLCKNGGNAWAIDRCGNEHRNLAEKELTKISKNSIGHAKELEKSLKQYVWHKIFKFNEIAINNQLRTLGSSLIRHVKNAHAKVDLWLNPKKGGWFANMQAGIRKKFWQFILPKFGVDLEMVDQLILEAEEDRAKKAQGI